ncbi:hypothetical protein RI129_007577 [Pyrocoelia pectoralis]|uniref:AMP-dependent synthetase/ligase domain-containing protein n=1 Tax=Pyrocoelia pectoralis TaxID=417401 RepID=A0AAN7ZIL9_9COLE
MQLATYRQFFNFKRLFLAYSIPNRSYNSHILYSQHEDIDIPKVTISEFVFEKFDQYPNKISLECAISGKKYTFDDVRKKSQNVAKNFMKLLKLTKGDVIAIILPNVPEFPICMLGALQAGIVTTTINPFFTPGEIARQLNDSNAKVVITSATTYASVYVAIKLTHKIIPAIVAKTKETETLPEGAINLHEFIDVESEIDIERNIQADDLAVLPYSSGTTGLPKGVLLSHHNIVASLSQITCKAVEHWITPTAIKDNVVPAIMPMFHIYGFSTILFAQFRLLSRIVCAPKFTPELFLDILKKHKPNVLYIVPQIVSFMSDHPSMKSEFFDSILSISSGGAALGRLDEEKLLNKAQKDINIMQGEMITD